jgi:zinc transporter ZupT
MEEQSATYLIASAAGAVFLGIVHLFAYRLKFLDVFPRSKWLSFAGGVSIAYIFVHLLPELEEKQHALMEFKESIGQLTRYPLYLVSLLSLCIYYGIERHAKLSGVSEKKPANDSAKTPEHAENTTVFYLHILMFGIYNALVGYTLRQEEWGLKELLTFVLAIGFHFMVNDIGFIGHYRHTYIKRGRWLLGFTPLLGWVTGNLVRLEEAHLGLVLAFIAGGTILNVMKEELPEERKSNYISFIAGATGYSILLLLLS